MTRPDFIRKLTDMLDAAERSKMFGSIEIELRAGHVVIIRKTETERFENAGETTHANKFQR